MYKDQDILRGDLINIAKLSSDKVYLTIHLANMPPDSPENNQHLAIFAVELKSSNVGVWTTIKQGRPIV